MQKLTTLLVVCLFSTTFIYAQKAGNYQTRTSVSSPLSDTDYRYGQVKEPVMNAVRIADNSLINLDGRLEESVWVKAPVATGFTQRAPVDGGKPSQRTEARILYTNSHIFVGIMAYETAPDSVNSPLFRRDGTESSDWVYVSFDSYNDKRTAFTFAVNPRGVQKDILYFDDNNEDILWDAVWEANTHQNGEGWSVEMKIPLSQLRFSSRDEVHSWGVNFQRRIPRHNEYNYWSPTSQQQSGQVSQFGRLEGISDLEEPRRLEIIPYASAKLARIPQGDAGDPYYESNDISANIGGDIKYGLTSDLTLTATINPDFGQVEADPATINLSAFETFFSERRPFFLEGSEIFRFGDTRTFNSAGNPNTFYSRRIGRAPQGDLSSANDFRGGTMFNADSARNSYQNFPAQTSILAAAKVSGKTKSGWSVGVLDAYTLEETAEYTVDQASLGNTTGEYAVEPASNYLVTRIKKDINEGNSVAGGFFSAVNRNIAGTYFESYLTNSAYIAGIDAEHNWKDREWVASGTFSVSQVNGSEQTITNIQRAPQRYYQRDDSEKLRVDSSKTSLEGFATELSLRKSSGKHWSGSVTYAEVSPGYETNDIGFQNRADYRSVALAIQYQETAPEKVQYYEFWSYHLHGWNYDGDRIWRNYNIGGFVRFKNQWYYNMNFNTSFNRISDRLTRGGPNMKYNDDFNFNFNTGTNQAKKFATGMGQSHRWDIEKEYDHYYWVWFNYRPTTFIQLSFEPEIGFEYDQDQFVDIIERRPGDPDPNQTFGNRYIFAEARRMSFVANIRLNWTFTPTMSLQTYFRPYISSGEFSNFGEFNAPGDFGFDYYGTDEGEITSDGEGSYAVDIDTDGSTDFEFERSDFTYRSIQGNAVFRWEYMPGSTLFLVWQQQREGDIGNGVMDIGRDLRGIFDPDPQNIFLVKVSFWFGS